VIGLGRRGYLRARKSELAREQTRRRVEQGDRHPLGDLNEVAAPNLPRRRSKPRIVLARIRVTPGYDELLAVAEDFDFVGPPGRVNKVGSKLAERLRGLKQ